MNKVFDYHVLLMQVFCTKSRPNCNGCPMRGECRHFASAFARFVFHTNHDHKELAEKRKAETKS